MNPYESPKSSWEDLNTWKSGGGAGDSAESVFLAWERLRLVYNAILIAESLLLAQWRLFNPIFWEGLVVGAIGANVCFCAGPCAEGYLCLIGIQRGTSRRVLFFLGTLIAVLLTFAAIQTFGSHVIKS